MEPTWFVRTIRERCRVCYTCVRECPAKAIRIAEGQAEVMPERCIGCGNCVRVCSQRAKQVASSIERVEQLLASGVRVAACVAPSFPAEFADIDYRQFVGMVRTLGFRDVNEVAFGADLVADRYHKLLAGTSGKRFIGTTCPAVVAYVERYHPSLVSSLSPIVSPMVATARALRRLHGSDLRIVFIGPCIAKKGEIASPGLSGEIDAALTFVELREMFASHGIAPDAVAPGDFDPPHPGAGALFPISRGMLQAARISEDLMIGEVVSAEGRTDFVEAIREFEAGDLDARLLEVLCCNGCIMGPGMQCQTPLFSRRSRVSHYVRRRMTGADWKAWHDNMDRLADLDLSRPFTPDDRRIGVPSEGEISLIMAEMGKLTAEDELNCGACGYETCRKHAIAIYEGLAECEMCLPYTIDQLRKTVKELAVSNKQLASTQEQLMQSEKLASMGQLAAGIAHEVNNPLGVVLMYAHLLLEENGGNPKLAEDLNTIVSEADRCKRIVSGLLHFARQNKVALQPTNLRELVDRVMRTAHLPSNISVRVEHGDGDLTAEIDPDQIVQVITNLVSNAQAAMLDGGTLTIRTGGNDAHVTLTVTDTGVGISRENLGKLFQPFFTTKQIGKGTGLGLAVTYGIVKMHRGDIQVQSNADPAAGPTGTTFTVSLPRRNTAG